MRAMRERAIGAATVRERLSLIELVISRQASRQTFREEEYCEQETSW